MANEQLSVDALRSLIKAMSTYHDSLSENIQTLQNAANICSQAMGNDTISKQHILNLEFAIVEFRSAESAAEEAVRALQEDLRIALDALT